jgi:tetratricopeptide (TPR) repeat protein
MVMLSTPFRPVIILGVIACFGMQTASAGGATLTIPRRSELTPVQRLNRDGVKAVKDHQYEKAEALFYKAYLYDPADPFTLNNLGYVAELQGQLDRAHKFYELASEQGCDADIDLSNVKQLEGKPMMSALANLKGQPMRLNRMNVDAMMLLSQSRAFEAVAVLEQARRLDPRDPFTLNNLGVADEAIGDYEGALKNYAAVVAAHSSEPVVVTLDRSWRGKTVSEMAAASAMRLKRRMQNANTSVVEAAMFNLHGVYEANQNDWAAAKQDFLRAYSLDAGSAFSLNNRAFVAERDGDPESAQFFYEKARRALDSGERIGMATQRSAEGKPLSSVAADSNRNVDNELDEYGRQRRRENGPVELTPRDGAPTGDSTGGPPTPQPSTPQKPQ